MDLNVFSTIGDYPTMLRKIAVFTFFTVLIELTLLRSQIPSLDMLLAPLTIQIPLLPGFSLPFGTVLPAFIIALIFRMIKFHDRVSDILHIRQRFDTSDVLLPLALATSGNLTISQIRSIPDKRKELMQKAFYAYASSSPGQAKIETYYITMALDQWSWYWILIESIGITLVTCIVLFVSNSMVWAFILLMLVLIAIAFMQIIRDRCADYAMREIEQIIGDPTRKTAIGKIFRGL